MIKLQVKIIIAALFLLVAHTVQAEKFSYVYVQGDKQTPFYIKFEGEMLPRFGKNYYIISELEPGPISIEVLFQQNAFPAQKFVINVPESGFRGFLLMQKDGAFSLYDIHRQFYLPANNTVEEDDINKPAVPAYASYTPVVPTPSIETKQVVSEQPIDAIPVPKPKEKPSVVVGTKKAPAKPISKILVDDNGPSFIGDMELSNNKTQKDANMLPAGGKVVAKTKLAVLNSDCPTAMGNNQFDALLKKVDSKTSTERLKTILAKMDNCYTSNQIRILTKTLTGDDMRFTLLKKAYSRVTDQSAFENLENLLAGEDWKKYFRDMVHK